MSGDDTEDGVFSDAVRRARPPKVPEQLRDPERLTDGGPYECTCHDPAREALDEVSRRIKAGDAQLTWEQDEAQVLRILGEVRDALPPVPVNPHCTLHTLTKPED